MMLRILHEIPGRIRFGTGLGRLTDEEAERFEFYLKKLPNVKKAKVYPRSGDAVVEYAPGENSAEGSFGKPAKRRASEKKPAAERTRGSHVPGAETAAVRRELLSAVRAFSLNDEALPAASAHARTINRSYQEKLVLRVAGRVLFNTFTPFFMRAAWTCFRAAGFFRHGMRCLLGRRLEVPVLDAAAIAASLLSKDFKTASSVMFLLSVGELMEEWTHKKSVADLAESMSLNVDKVWLRTGGTEVLVPIEKVKAGDCIVVGMGSLIPLDGVVQAGEALVNQASLTGESQGVKKSAGSSVYAGTVLEEGELFITVKQASGETRYEKIIQMIEDSEKMKSALEGKAAHLADRLVPYSFFGTALTFLLTRNVQKAVSVLMVDFSCALKLSMPVAVLSAMRECSEHGITVKGGKFLEALAEADTIVFDKTGTLTKAQPSVREVIPFGGRTREEVLRIAACLEEHFPHSIANAVVKKAEDEHLKHREMHTKVHYVIAHGIASEIAGEKARIGSYHFLFEDEDCKVPAGEEEKFGHLPDDCSLLYLSIADELAGVICIEDPLREEAPEVLRRLKALGVKNLVMMTGDSERTARVIAKRVGVDQYYSEVLPEDKARFVEAEKARGRKVVMIGDGINDSPALSAADAGIAISEGAQLAREIADITISEDNLYGLVSLKEVSNALMRRVGGNYRFVIGFNAGLLALGLLGVLAPGSSAFLHNLSTLAVGLHSMTNLTAE